MKIQWIFTLLPFVTLIPPWMEEIFGERLTSFLTRIGSNLHGLSENAAYSIS